MKFQAPNISPPIWELPRCNHESFSPAERRSGGSVKPDVGRCGDLFFLGGKLGEFKRGKKGVSPHSGLLGVFPPLS